MPIRNPRRPETSLRHSFPQPPVSSGMYRNIAVTFLVVVILVIGVVVWMSSVRATVTIHAKREATKINSVVEIAKSPEQGQLQGRVVEGVFDNIQEFKVKEQASSTVSGVMRGRVRITNNYSKAQPLVQKTRLLTADGKLFRISTTVNVPSGKTVDVEAYSDQPGQEFAISTATKFTIPGLWVDLQKWIYAESITPFTGETKNVKLVGADEITNAQNSLSDVVVEQAKKTLMAEAGVTAEQLSDVCPEQLRCWQAIYFVKPIDKKSNVTPGQQSDGFLAQVKVKVTGVFYPRKDMEALIRSKLKDKMSDGKELVRFDPSTVSYTLETLDTSLEKARLNFTAEASSRPTPQSSAFAKEGIAGMRVVEAKRKLMALDGVDSVDIYIRPSWTKTIPSRLDAIDVTVE